MSRRPSTCPAPGSSRQGHPRPDRRGAGRQHGVRDCGSGGRSARAVQFLNAQGHDTVNVPGAARPWRAAGIRSSTEADPIDSTGSTPGRPRAPGLEARRRAVRRARTEFHRERQATSPTSGWCRSPGRRHGLVDPVAATGAARRLLTGRPRSLMQRGQPGPGGPRRVCAAVPAGCSTPGWRRVSSCYRGPVSCPPSSAGGRRPAAQGRPSDRLAAASDRCDIAALRRGGRGPSPRRRPPACDPQLGERAGWRGPRTSARRSAALAGRRDPEEAVWRIKEARQLRGRSARLARRWPSGGSVWRSNTTPGTGSCCRLALIGIAQRPPGTHDERGRSAVSTEPPAGGPGRRHPGRGTRRRRRGRRRPGGCRSHATSSTVTCGRRPRWPRRGWPSGPRSRRRHQPARHPERHREFLLDDPDAGCATGGAGRRRRPPAPPGGR